MPQKQATGIDTHMMVPVYVGVFGIVCQLFLPWLSMPILKYSRFPTEYSIFNMEEFVTGLEKCAQTSKKIKMQPFTSMERMQFQEIGWLVRLAGIVVAVMLLVAIIAVIAKRSKSSVLVRSIFGIQLFWTVVQFALSMKMNGWINNHLGRANTFQNLSIHSQVQLTSWVYAQMLLSGLMVWAVPRLLCTQQPVNLPRPAQSKERWRKRTWMALLIILMGIPAAIFFGIYFLNDRSSIFIGCCIICLAMVPFAMMFEDRHPQARELLMIAVMATIGVVGRAAFFMVPQFKPTAAVVIIAGVSLGAEAGFLTGAVAAFVSNFFFGQGPWTPWQMFAMGMIGFLAGVLFAKQKNTANRTLHRILLSIFGGAAAFGIYGFIMDFSSIVTATQAISKELIVARMLSGLPFNLIHGAATTLFLLVLSDPMERKIQRVRKKYGLLQP